MKKTIAILLVILLLGLCSVSFASSTADMFSGDPAPAQSEWDGAYDGHWEAIGMGAETVAPTTLFMNMQTAAIGQMDIKADGTYSLFLLTTHEEGTWESADDGITLTHEDTSIAAKMENGQLIYEQDGILIYFAKGTFAVSTVPTESAWDGQLEGDWVCIGMDIGSGFFHDNLMGIPAANIMTLSFAEGGVLTGTSPMSGQTEPATGTWEGTADALTLTMSDQPQSAKIVNGQLMMNMNGMLLAFAKQ